MYLPLGVFFYSVLSILLFIINDLLRHVIGRSKDKRFIFAM